MFSNKNKTPSSSQDLHEEWQDWTKSDWIAHQSSEEAKRLESLSTPESDEEFAWWCIKKGVELNRKKQKLRDQGLLPDTGSTPQYGNRPSSGVIIAGTQTSGAYGPGGGRGPGAPHGGFGGPGGPGGFSPGSPGGPGR